MENTNVKKWEQIDFAVYLRFALPWALLAVVIEILFRILSVKLGSGPLFDYKDYFIWAIRIIAIGFIGWREIKAFGSNTVIGAIAGIIAGSFIGLVSSLYLFSEGFKVWKIFNVFSETVFMAVLCAAILVIMSSIFKSKIKK